MKYKGLIAGIAIITMVMAGSPAAFADSFGLNITAFDGKSPNGVNQGLEDNETESGTLQAQVWDLEGMFLDGNALGMVGGYDFKDGQPYPYTGTPNYTYRSGDIFLDIGANTWDINDLNAASAWDTNGTGHSTSTHGTSFSNSLGWDYAIRMNFGATNTYTVWQLFSDTLLRDTTDISKSNPWRVDDSAGNHLVDVTPLSNTFKFVEYADDSQVPFLSTGFGAVGTSYLGSAHYAVTGFDLGFLAPGQNFIAHFTMECGNDLLIGQGTTSVPEPGSLVLLGLGLVGIAIAVRSRRQRADAIHRA